MVVMEDREWDEIEDWHRSMGGLVKISNYLKV
jgi:hypothetical protein